MQGAAYRALSGADFSVAVLDHWTSPQTGIVYPSLWQVAVDGAVYVVTPLVADQEFREPPPFETYWEGDVQRRRRQPARSSVRRTWS